MSQARALGSCPGLSELKDIAEEILRIVMGEDAELRWMERIPLRRLEVRIEEEAVEEWTDGSRMEGCA